MKVEIRRRLFVQRWINITSDWAGKTALVLGMMVLISHRVFAVDAVWTMVLIVLMPVYTWIWLKRTPVEEREVRQYAERSSGETGLLWFENEVKSEDWQQQIANSWSQVQLPSVEIPTQTRWSVIALLMYTGSLWIPLKKSWAMHAVPIIQQELSQIEQQLAMLDDLTIGEDQELEEWKQQIEEMSDSDDIATSLSQIDGLSDQMSTRQEEMVEALQQALDALESRGKEDLSNAMKNLQDQHLIPPSASGEDSAAPNNQIGQQAGEKASGSQNDQSATLKKEMEALKERIQSMQSAQSSGGTQMTSANNEQLQQMAKMLEETSGKSPSDKGKEGEGKEGKGANGKSNSDSEQCSLGEPGCVPGKGGTESAPLTFGEPNPLQVPEVNLSAIQGVTEVDWDNSVYFGEGPGTYSGLIVNTQNNDGSVSVVTEGTSSTNAIPPNQRQIVQQYFSNESTAE